MAKQAAKKTNKAQQMGFEEAMWESGNKLRGSVDNSQYFHMLISESEQFMFTNSGNII